MSIHTLHAAESSLRNRLSSSRALRGSAGAGIDRNEPTDHFIEYGGDLWLKISNSQCMPDFFSMPASASDHWMFISSRGALSAGRRSPDAALFPYYSCDKISDAQEHTGSLTIIRATDSSGQEILWRPFQRTVADGSFSRSVSKSLLGNRIRFEEVDHSLSLAFRYEWTFSDRFGFVRRCEIENLADEPVELEVLDGLQNLLPAGLTQAFQMKFSNLGDAYKQQELVSETQLGIYHLSSVPTDKAEPAEGLRATTVWHTGLARTEQATGSSAILLGTDQVRKFMRGEALQGETAARGQRGAYLVNRTLTLSKLAGEQAICRWSVVADTLQDHNSVVELNSLIAAHTDWELDTIVDADVRLNQERLMAITSSADGATSGANRKAMHRHHSSVLYNVMRGGLPKSNYQIGVPEFLNNLRIRNREVHERHAGQIRGLGRSIAIQELIRFAEGTGDADLMRLTREYLPLTFGRRHGDPSRPWNWFSIDLTDENGAPKSAWQGNWRDIFQNWEAVAFSWPELTTSMIRRFVNASTADGYNPYRISDEGVDWEAPTEEEFASLGYWGDHQIIYLLKLLEWQRQIDPAQANQLLQETGLVSADVPYRIVGFEAMKRDPYRTIEFDDALEANIADRVSRLGTDGKLLRDREDNICQWSMLEKLLIPALVKMTNFVPEGGIWMNTQRPEWNDANNALVGNGLSMVTVCYLRRYFQFVEQWFADHQTAHPERDFEVSELVWELCVAVEKTLSQEATYEAVEGASSRRLEVVEALAHCGAAYRNAIYQGLPSKQRRQIKLSAFSNLLASCKSWLDGCIANNRRDDGLYHSYNLLEFESVGISVQRLDEMLEGQVAAISSGALSGQQCCDALDALRASALYTADRDSYLLYPNRRRPAFLEKNRLPTGGFERSKLLQLLNSQQRHELTSVNVEGVHHFNPAFMNVDELHQCLDRLSKDSELTELVESERSLIAAIYEETFVHRQFTGRSKTFFGYEGLGSIYWHMVSKLALAVVEQVVAMSDREDAQDLQEAESNSIRERLVSHYYQIQRGLGLDRTPAQVGAFATDAYSHTPESGGARQPGMTGQVKEDVLCRMAEIGARVHDGIVRFSPDLLRRSEFYASDSTFEFVSVGGVPGSIKMPAGTFGWTWCQVPVVYHISDQQRIELSMAGGDRSERPSLELTRDESLSLFGRRGEIERIDVYFQPQR